MNIWWLSTAERDGYSSYNELKYRKVLAQGWSQLGNLSVLKPLLKDESKFRNAIKILASQIYSEPTQPSDPERVLFNLLSFRENDLVLCTEGVTVMGIAKVGENPIYRYDDGGAGQHEYAQTICPVIEWKDWDVGVVGKPPYNRVNGIEHYQGDAQSIIDAWNKL